MSPKEDKRSTTSPSSTLSSFSPVSFIHVPEPHKHLVHFYGAYANRLRQTYRPEVETDPPRDGGASRRGDSEKNSEQTVEGSYLPHP